MEDLSQYSSLERYVLTRGRHLVSLSPSMRGLNIQFGIGLALIALSGLMVLYSLMFSLRGVALGAICPMIAGVANAAVAWGLKRSFGQSQDQAPEISPEARTMLTRLGWTYIWSKNPWVLGMQLPQTPAHQDCQWGMARKAHIQQYSWRHSMNHRSLSEAPSEVLQQMEQAASHFNRISGALEASGSTGAVQRLRSKILQAADEAMIDVLHQSQLASQFPEGIKAIQGRLSSDLATLSELGDRVEAMTLREPTFTDLIARRTTADEVLEELRLEQSAFTELSSEPEDGPRNHLQA